MSSLRKPKKRCGVRLVTIYKIICIATLLACGCAGARNAGNQPEVKIYALKYGESSYKSSLVNTLSRDRLVKFNWLFYLVVLGNPPRYTLVDTGFANPGKRNQFGLKKHKSAAELLARVGVTPDQISRVFLTHSHFDHAENLPQFKNAEVYLQADEYRALSDTTIAACLKKLESQGKLHLLNHERARVDEFATIFTGGHTPGSQAVQLATGGKSYIFTGDECYFQDACRAGVPLPKVSAHSQVNNAKFLGSLSTTDVILTGHETNSTAGRWLDDCVYLIEAVP